MKNNKLEHVLSAKTEPNFSILKIGEHITDTYITETDTTELEN